MTDGINSVSSAQSHSLAFLPFVSVSRINRMNGFRGFLEFYCCGNRRGELQFAPTEIQMIRAHIFVAARFSGNFPVHYYTCLCKPILGRDIVALLNYFEKEQQILLHF